jgi:hypothetical protein
VSIQDPPLTLNCGLPSQDTDMLTDQAYPSTVIVFDMMSVLRSCSMISVNTKASGSMSFVTSVHLPPVSHMSTFVSFAISDQVED